MLANIVSGFIIIMVGISLAPSVANEVAGARYPRNATGSLITSNVTGASSTVLGLTVLFYNLAIASIAIGVSAQGLKNTGLI